MKPLVHQSELRIIGIQIQTTNENGQSFRDMSQLWSRFFSENVLNQIPSKSDNSIISLYTNYKNPGNPSSGKYTAILGAAVKSLDQIPSGMVGFMLPPGLYQEHPVLPSKPEEVGPSWQKIWELPSSICKRNFLGDFEIYKANGQISIFVGIDPT